MGSVIETLTPPADITNQTIEIPNSGGVRHSTLSPLGEITDLEYDDAKTVLEMMQRGYKKSQNGNCLGWRDETGRYNWLSYGDVIRRSRHFSSGLVKIGMEVGQSSFVGIYCQNRVEWVLTEQACYNQSVITVPIYTTLSSEDCIFIINQAEIKIIVCDKLSNAKSLLDHKESTPNLNHIILTFDPSDELKESANGKGVCLHRFEDIEEIGEENPVSISPPKPEDVATVCYTSGTTGEPKGALITHKNLICVSIASHLHMGKYGFKETDVHMSFLPLAHIFERYMQVHIFLQGGSVGFFSGNVNTLLDDLQALKPTVMPVVPRVLNKIHDQFYASMGKSLKRFLISHALRSKQADVEKFMTRRNSVWDYLLFNSVRNSMGGRLRFVLTGAAPCADHVLRFFRCALGCVFIQGYGQTESTGPSLVGIPGDYSVGNVGAPIPCNLIKLADIPEMGYFSKDGQGEVCIKGTNVFSGYLKRPDKTSEALDDEGWLHTGDIGRWLPNGAMKIIDRKKHVFKLSQGEYVAPEKIENVYIMSQYISQIFVYGNSYQSYVVAVAVPDKELLLGWCKMNDIAGEWKDICQNKMVRDFLLNELQQLGRSACLKGYEQVKKIYIHPDLLTPDTGVFTPTMKTKRHDCYKYFKDVIEAMYAEKV